MSDNKPIQKKKYFFDVKVEHLVPTTFVYRVEAESESEALKKVEKNESPHKQIIPSYNKRKRLSAVVYLSQTSMIKLSKKY